ncbi:N-acetylmuramoyl-L-alanine amidase [Prevotella sp. MGM2]|uniref:peptidoglycan recognition protein family protein n=1 Tax=Prevotella sp. MGM2 TaxID=2033406 RepID=UPI000CEA47BA|nr:N-acetylmuramoyl-L-alanine amidase [Prevotella sp. MGM2]GAY30706.1 n-acetylmuramoyl-L-alanine amidase [Prevotella sp. MGM2]
MEILKKGSRGESVKTLQNALHLMPDGIFGSLTEEAVKQHQRSYGLKVDGIVGPNTWAVLRTGEVTQLLKSKRKIKEIIVHCSATPEGKDFTVADIRAWHLQRGFSDIGYHYVIYRDGSVHKGRDINISGAHCTGHNSISIGICYIGGQTADGTPKDTRTDAQKKALLKLLKELKKLYPNATIHGHKEFAAKACPCFEVKDEYFKL